MAINPNRRPRILNEMWAILTGKFWLPCPRCGREFGGHELGGVDVKDDRGMSTCWRCPGERRWIPGYWQPMSERIVWDQRHWWAKS